MRKVAPSEDAIGQLKLAGTCMTRAIEALLAMDSTVVDCPAHLQSADAILKGLNQGSVLADRNRLEPMLQALAGQSATAAKLLESAASLRFGSFLGHHVSGLCYTPDGSPEGTFGGRSLLIEG